MPVALCAEDTKKSLTAELFVSLFTKRNEDDIAKLIRCFLKARPGNLSAVLKQKKLPPRITKNLKMGLLSDADCL